MNHMNGLCTRAAGGTVLVPIKKRLLLVEDHTILREGLRLIVGENPSLEIVGEAGDGREGIRKAIALTPDLVITDLSMPGLAGLDVVRAIRRRLPQVKLIVLTVHDNEEYLFAALEAGAGGYVLKDATKNELMSAIETVLQGKTYLSPAVQQKVVSAFVRGGTTAQPSSPLDLLTARERQVLKMIAEGRTNKEIAQYLCISVKTVEKHRSNLMTKVGVHNTAALTAFAVTRGLLDA